MIGMVPLIAAIMKNRIIDTNLTIQTPFSSDILQLILIKKNKKINESP